MKKVLVFLYDEKIMPKGGPYGYNYNLLSGLSEIDSDICVEFLKEELDFKHNKLNNTPFVGIEKKCKFFESYEPNDLKKYINYDVIHFHTSSQMYRARNFLDCYNGVVLFTSHSPMLLSKEMFEDAGKLSKIVFKPFFKKIRKVDIYAFQRADYVIFPCEDAEEPYINEEIFTKAKSEKEFLYMTTGVFDCKEKIKISRDIYRSRYNIPKDAVVFSYVGRHNEVKGYKNLQEAGKRILEKYSNVYFLIGGKEEPISGIKDKHWIEVGYTNDPHSLVNASDVFVLPNKQTYFDLVFLEVLSIGKKMIVSNTGGNKYFKKFKSDGIVYFETIDDLVKTIQIEIDQTNHECNCRDIYNKEFTCKMFAKRYLELLDNVMRKEDE